MAFTFGLRLVTVRKARGITQTALAERCGFARSTISRYEKGAMDISRTHARILGKALEVTPGYFVTDDDDRDALPIEQVLAEESLKCFCQEASIVSSDRTKLGRVAQHVASPTTVEGWKKLMLLIRDGLITVSVDDGSTRSSDPLVSTKFSIVTPSDAKK